MGRWGDDEMIYIKLFLGYIPYCIYKGTEA